MLCFSPLFLVITDSMTIIFKISLTTRSLAVGFRILRGTLSGFGETAFFSPLFSFSIDAMNLMVLLREASASKKLMLLD